MDVVLQFAQGVSARQDFFWFLVVLVAAINLSLWWRSPSRSNLVPAAAGAAMVLLVGLSAWLAFLTPARMQHMLDVPHRWADFVAGGALAALPVVWAWPAHGARWWRALLVVAGSGLILSRWWLPEASALVVAIGMLPAMAVVLRQNRAVPGAEVFWLVVAAWGAPPSIVGWWLREPFRSIDLGRFAPASAALMLVAVAWGAVRLGRDEWRGWPPARKSWLARRSRQFAYALAGWLTLGIVAAGFAGRSARRSFEASALSRIRAYAETFPTGELAAVMRSDWVPEELESFEQQTGVITRYAFVDALKTTAQTTAQLIRLRESNPDFSMVEVSTLADGMEWIVAMPGTAPGYEGVVMVTRTETPLAREHWERRDPWQEGPVQLSVGEALMFRAPLLSDGGAMLGWLQASVPVGEWAGMQAQTRLMAFGLLTAGALVGVLLFLRRVREEEAEDALREADRERTANQLKSAFLANVSHELRTPVQSFTGYTELLLHDELSEIARSRVEALQRNGELMARLINDLIDIGALDSGAFRLVEKPVQPAVLISQTVESLRPRAEQKGLELRCSLPRNLPAWVRWDPERCRQIVLNLLGNAVKYTAKGEVDVTVNAAAMEPGHWLLEVVVSDTGPGIPSDQLTQIFNPFSRLDRTATVEGVGLGLALSQRLARRMGGDIRVQSELGKGAAFTVELPAETAAPPAPVARPGAGLHGQRILVVDDNQLVRDLFVQGLRRYGAVCSEEGDGLAALQRLENERFDGMVVDLAMPGCDGCEVVRRLRQAGKLLKVVGVSAHAGQVEREQALKAGMDAFLTKPVDLAQLAHAFSQGPAVVEPDEAWQRLVVSWQQTFREELPARLSDLETALEASEWESLFRAAHRLSNSAMVVRDHDLYGACGDLQEASRMADQTMAAAAWERCRSASQRWLDPSTESPAQTFPS